MRAVRDLDLRERGWPGADILACRRNGPVAALSSGNEHRPVLKSGFERRAGLS